MKASNLSIMQVNGRALALNKAKLTAKGLVVTADLSFGEWEEVGRILWMLETSIQWALGDWLNYGEGKWGEMYVQALGECPTEETEAKKWRKDYQLLADYKWVSNSVNFSFRNEKLSWTHHRQIADLDPEKQVEWLRKAVENGWSANDLRKAVNYGEKHSMALPDGKFQVIYADCPWEYENSGFENSATSLYPTMPTDDICQLPIPTLATDRSVLFLWATNPLLKDALRVMEAWGFEYKTNIAWVKDKGRGFGWFLKSKHELLLIGVRENTPEPVERPDSAYIFPRPTEHSRKPDGFYEIIESMYLGSKVELFARQTRKGWTAYGNEPNLIAV